MLNIVYNVGTTPKRRCSIQSQQNRRIYTHTYLIYKPECQSYIRFHPFRSYLTSFLKVICRPCLAAFASHAYTEQRYAWVGLTGESQLQEHDSANMHELVYIYTHTTALTRQFSLLRHFRRRCLENSQFIHNLKTFISVYMYIYMCASVYVLSTVYVL